MPGRGNPVALGDLYAARWVGAQQDTGQKGDPLWGYGNRSWAGLNTSGFPLVLTCLRIDYPHSTDYEVKAKKSASDTTVNNGASRANNLKAFSELRTSRVKTGRTSKGIDRTERPPNKRVGAFSHLLKQGKHTYQNRDDSSNIDNVLRLVVTL